MRSCNRVLCLDKGRRTLLGFTLTPIKEGATIMFTLLQHDEWKMQGFMLNEGWRKCSPLSTTWIEYGAMTRVHLEERRKCSTLLYNLIRAWHFP